MALCTPEELSMANALETSTLLFHSGSRNVSLTLPKDMVLLE
jgi:hypothetical protein